ncbi:MAG: hypothetical protein J6C45_02575 [Alistipes sp.]|nr:hypothetical protein [Alistipes sp.]
MKRLAAILLGLMLASCSVGYYSNNGMGLSTVANISVQPDWGPAGYDCANFYYFPEHNFYYDVNRALFYYYHNRQWLSAKHLPYGLGYPRDLYRLYKVVLNNISKPWKYNRRHIMEYKHYGKIHNQPVLHPHKAPQYNGNRPNRPPQNGYGPSYNNNNRPPQMKPQQGNGSRYENNYGSDRNTIRNSRNNNTSRNNVTPQRGNGANNNGKVQQPKPQPKPQGQGARPTVKSSNKSQSSPSVKGSRSNSSSSSKSKSSTRSNSSSSSSSNGRSTGSRGR